MAIRDPGFLVPGACPDTRAPPRSRAPSSSPRMGQHPDLQLAGGEAPSPRHPDSLSPGLSPQAFGADAHSSSSEISVSHQGGPLPHHGHPGPLLCCRAPRSWPRRSWPMSPSSAGCGTSRRWSSARASGSMTARRWRGACCASGTTPRSTSYVRPPRPPARAPRGAHGPGPSCPLTSPRRHAHARSGCSHTCTYTRVHTYTLRVLPSHADAHTRTLRVLVTHMHIHTRAHIQTQDAHLTRTRMPMRAHAHMHTPEVLPGAMSRGTLASGLPGGQLPLPGHAPSDHAQRLLWDHS